MKRNKILILNGHPDKESFNNALSNAYVEGSEDSNAKVSVINIADLKFNPNLKYGYRKKTELEPDLLYAIEKIKAANHIVWFFPMWWYGYPAIMKGFIDRVFLPGITFKFEKGKTIHEKLLMGKSGHIIVTADSPKWYNNLFMKIPAINQLKKGTMKFCGISPVKVSYIGPLKNSSSDFRNKWLMKMKKLGKQNK